MIIASVVVGGGCVRTELRERGQIVRAASWHRGWWRRFFSEQSTAFLFAWLYKQNLYHNLLST